MFKRNSSPATETSQPIQAVERITSVLGSGVVWHGNINGSGGVRIEGAFEGAISLRGMLVIGETGRVTCENITTEDVGNAAVFLASDLSSRVTGDVLYVDSGFNIVGVQMGPKESGAQ